MGKYKTRTTLEELEKLLGDEFVEVRRGCLVSIMAIQSVTDMIHHSNSESLKYVIRKKKEILAHLQTRQKEMFGGCSLPIAEVEYPG